MSPQFNFLPEIISPTAQDNDELIFEEELTPIEAQVVRKMERKQRRRARSALALGAAALTASSISFIYWQDVSANQAIAEVSQPEIRSLDTQDGVPSDSSIFYFAGFDTRNGDVFGQRVGIALQQIVPGENLSIDYGDAPLDVKELSERIISYAEEKDLESISLAGNSIGGIIALEVAQRIIHDSEVKIDAIFLNATPDGTSGLLPETQNELATMIKLVENIPGAKYSNFARYAISMALENNSYTRNGFDIGQFLNTSDRVWEQVRESRRPGTWLLVDQAFAVINADIESSLRDIGAERDTKQMPVVISMRANNPEDDVVVDVKVSSANICSYAAKAALACQVVLVDGAVHTSYQFDTEAYTVALKENTERLTTSIENEKTYEY